MKVATRNNRKNGVAELRAHAANLGQDVQDLAATAGQLARRQLDPLENYVRERPMRALLMAAGAGAVLGLLLWRR